MHHPQGYRVLMTTVKTNAIRRPPLIKWFAFQAVVVFLMGALFWIKSPVAAYSALAGGFIFLLPNVYFAIKAFRYTGARAAKRARWPQRARLPHLRGPVHYGARYGNGRGR